MARSQKDLFRSIVTGKYEFEEESWAHVSEEAKDLVRKLLVTDPSERLTSREAMESPWMRQRGDALKNNNLKYTSQKLKGFNARMKLRASMISVRSIARLKLSLRGSEQMAASQSSVSSSTEQRRPSFLKLPIEGDVINEEKEEDDKC